MSLPAEPLIFNQIYFSTIWGGQRLRTHFNKSIPTDTQTGESWEISGLDNYQSVVSRGTLRGQTLGNIYTLYPQALIGESAPYHTLFPLLIKFIDAHDALSVQVHPDNQEARIRFGEPYGKTECWYIADTGPNAAIGIGFIENITRDVLRNAIINGTLKQYLQIFPVKIGEVYYIPAGTVHVIMGDVIIYEIQQSSNTTLRMYDWQRTDALGKSRPLRIEDAIAIADLSGKKNYRIEPLTLRDSEKKMRNIRIACPYFALEEYQCNKNESRHLEYHHSCRILSIVEGIAELGWKDGRIDLYKGSSVLIPAILEEVTLTGCEECVCLSAFIPNIQRDIIDPLINQGFSPSRIARLGEVSSA